MREKINKLNNLIEKIRPVTPMSEEDSKVFLLLLGAHVGYPEIGLEKNDAFNEVITEDNPKIKEDVGMRILIDRLNKMAKLKITLGAALFVAQQIINPGQAVVYAYYIHRKFNNGDTVTFNDLTMNGFFELGVLSDQQINDIWDVQKINTKEEEEKARKELGLVGVHDNLLDYIKTWEK